MIGARKPPLGTQINWNHPMARGLVGCWLFNEGGGNVIHSATLLSGNLSYRLATLPSVDSVTNLGLRTTTSSSSGPKIADAVNFQQQSFSIVVRGTYESTTADQAWFGGGGTSSSGFQAWKDEYTSDRFGLAVYDGLTRIDYGSDCNPGQSYDVVFVHDLAASESRLYVDGRVDITIAYAIAVASSGLWIGRANTGSKNRQGLTEYAHVYDRVLSASEILRLHDTPFCFLTHPLQVIPVPFIPSTKRVIIW